jgi:hypothetical protein
VAVHELERDASSETKFSGTLIFDFLPPQLRENKLLLFKSHSYGILLRKSYPTNTPSMVLETYKVCLSSLLL